MWCGCRFRLSILNDPLPSSTTSPGSTSKSSCKPSATARGGPLRGWRSEEHTSELQSLMRISYAVFCLKKKTQAPKAQTTNNKTKLHHNKKYTQPHTHTIQNKQKKN